YCEGHGYTVVAEYKDKDVSGERADNRPGLQKANAAACERKAVLCVYSLSRLARCTKDAIDLAERLSAARPRGNSRKRQHPLADGPVHLHAILGARSTGARADRRTDLDCDAQASGEGPPHDPAGPLPLRLAARSVRSGPVGRGRRGTNRHRSD